MLEAKGVFKSYNDLAVLKNINLVIKEKEVLSIVGASGAGKSTLLHILGTLDKADGGSISIDGQNISNLSADGIAKFRNKHIGFVFQSHNLLPEFTALENVCLPAFIAKRTPADAKEQAKELMGILGVYGRAGHYPSQMSGGEQQRVAVARALINSPAVVFADEPSGNLDSQNAQGLHKLFFDLRERFGQTFVIVTHNQQLAKMADRTIQIQDGQLQDLDAGFSFD